MNTARKTFTASIVTCLSALTALASVPSQVSAEWFACRPTSVTYIVNQSRVQVTCSNSSPRDRTQFLSFANTDNALTDRFISVATAAILSGKELNVYTYDSGASNPVNCLAANCRPVTEFSLGLGRGTF